MRKHSNILFTPLSKEAFATLACEVKETIAPAATASHPKIFTDAELWNVQRQVKARVQRRFL